LLDVVPGVVLCCACAKPLRVFTKLQQIQPTPQEIEHQLKNPINQLFALVADRIPGVVVPKSGWLKATESDREIATSAALFDEILGICDKNAGRRFAEKFFGGAVAKPRAPAGIKEQAKPVIVKPEKKQTSMNTYFMDKLIVQAMDASKKAAAKKAKANAID
jgi:hypothetical protein